MVPAIVELAENHWQELLLESLKALKTILKDIDAKAFDDAIKMSLQDRKKFQIKQTEDERRSLDKKWDLLNAKI